MAMQPFTFLHSSRRVIFGWDSLAKLAELAKEFGCKRPAVVLDAFFMPTPLKVRLSKLLEEATGTEPLFHSVPEHEPDTASVEACAPALTVSAPKVVTAYAGYDAVTHAVEAYVSKGASVMTDAYAVSAMELLAKWLPVAYREPDHAEARSACLIASMQAAIAFNSANL